jgi:hypothetical protein
LFGTKAHIVHEYARAVYQSEFFPRVEYTWA